MRSAEKAARLLAQGLLQRAAWPEFDDDEFVAEVRERLGAVGLDLAAGDGYWVARGRDGTLEEGFEPIFDLNEAELAVLAALYLHLRYLPRHGGGVARTETPSVAVEDIERGFPYDVTYVRSIVGRLRNMHFVRQHDKRLYPGPYLAALDEIVADERAKEALRDFKLRRFLQRRVAEAKERVDAAD